MKKAFAWFLVLTMLLSLAACSSGESGKTTTEPTAESTTEATVLAAAEPTAQVSAAKTVGIVMHSADLARWDFSGNYLKAQLEAAGHTVRLIYSEDAAGQNAAISELLANHADLLIVAPVDGDALSIDSAEIPVIAYSCRIPAADYSVSFSSEAAGALQAQYLISKLDLANAGGEQLRVELVGENPGALDVLKPWLDAGTLTIPSGKTASTLDDFQNALTSLYAEGICLDAVLCAEDAADVIAAIHSGYAGGNTVLIADQGGEPDSLQRIADNTQTMTVYCNVDDEAAAALALANALLAGESADASALLTPWAIDKDNLSMLVESGSYTWDADGHLIPTM